MLVSSSPYKEGRPDALAVLESPKRPRMNKSFLGTLPVFQEGDEVALPVLPMEDNKDLCETVHKEENSSRLDKSFSLGDEQFISQSNVSILTNAKNESKEAESVVREMNEERDEGSRRMEEWEVVSKVENQEKRIEKEDERVDEKVNENRNENENDGGNVNVNENENENITKRENENKNENKNDGENKNENENKNDDENKNENDGRNVNVNENIAKKENENDSETSLDISSPIPKNTPPIPEPSTPNPNSNPSEIQELLAHFRLVIADLDQNPTDLREIQEIQLQIQRLQGISIDPLNTQMIQEVSDLFRIFTSFFVWFSAAEANRAVWFPFFFFCVQFIQTVLLENQSIKLCFIRVLLPFLESSKSVSTARSLHPFDSSSRIDSQKSFSLPIPPISFSFSANFFRSFFHFHSPQIFFYPSPMRAGSFFAASHLQTLFSSTLSSTC